METMKTACGGGAEMANCSRWSSLVPGNGRCHTGACGRSGSRSRSRMGVVGGLGGLKVGRVNSFNPPPPWYTSAASTLLVEGRVEKEKGPGRGVVAFSSSSSFSAAEAGEKGRAAVEDGQTEDGRRAGAAAATPGAAAAAATKSTSKSSLIRKWLPGWAGKRLRKKGMLVRGVEDVPYANQLDRSSFDDDGDAVWMMGDGMASACAEKPPLTDSAKVTEYSMSATFFGSSNIMEGGVYKGADTFTAAAAELEAMKRAEREGVAVGDDNGGGQKKRWQQRGARKTSSPVIDSPPIQGQHATLELIRNRLKSNSKPGERTDEFKLGLVIEGGGMRGCVSGGALQALADLGLRDVFDALYGSSAGAINGTYFLSGQRDGVDIYHEHIASPEFINLKRLIRRKPGTPAALNLEFLLDHVIHNVHPLDFDAVLSSPIPLKVVASSLDTLKPVLLEDFEHKKDMIQCLRASANVPEVAGGPVYHRGHRLVDAAVFEAVPFRSAIADGCTHILVLCTRPVPARKSALDKALSDAVQSAVKKAVMNPSYMVDAWKASVESLVMDGLSHDDMLLRSLDEDSHLLPWFAGSHVLPLYPSSHASSFSPLCTDVPTLRDGVAEGRRTVLSMARSALSDVIELPSPLEVEISAANIVPSSLKEKRVIRAKSTAERTARLA